MIAFAWREMLMSPQWWMSVIVGGLVFGVLASYVRTGLDRAFLKFIQLWLGYSKTRADKTTGFIESLTDNAHMQLIFCFMGLTMLFPAMAVGLFALILGFWTSSLPLGLWWKTVCGIIYMAMILSSLWVASRGLHLVWAAVDAAFLTCKRRLEIQCRECDKDDCQYRPKD